MKRTLLLALLLLTSALAYGKITLPSLISNNMVLQQQSDVRIWGWAEPGEEICISTSWSKKNTTAIAGPDRKWSAYLKTPKHCTGQQMTIASASCNQATDCTNCNHSPITISNILIGEVWLASGQSNMEFEMRPHPTDKWMTGMYNWEEESDKADYPNIHLFKVEEKWDHNTPQDNCNGEWLVCTPEVAKRYSAIAYLFAKEIHTTLNRPVGIILCAFGGTHAESWSRMEIMENDTLYQKVLESYAPDKDVCIKYPHKVPSAIWNAMVNPIKGYTIKGNIWYQAESNAWRAKDYPQIFVNMVNDWREQWQQKHLPFYFMQVAPYGTMPGIIRKMQSQVWESGQLEEIGMPTAIDVGDSLDIHPKDKITPAHRFALWALAKEYGFNVKYQGPTLKSAKAHNNQIIISFKEADGLYSKEVIRYLHISGKDGVWYPACSKIEGNKLIVWHPQISNPTSVKYCSEDYCKGEIYNGAGLPAYPFEVILK